MNNAVSIIARIGGTILILVIINAVSYFMDCGYVFY